MDFIGPMKDAAARKREIDAAVAWTKQHVARVFGKSVVELRALADKNKTVVPVPDGTVMDKVIVGGVPCLWVTAPGVDPDRVVFYVHGGGFTMGSPETHRRLAADIGAAANARVLLVQYRLAPEHPFPIGPTDCFEAYRGLLARDFEPKNIAFGGDSAGGALVLATLLQARDAGLPLPACTVCLSPWVNLVLDGETLQTKKDVDPLGDSSSFQKFVDAYLAGTDPRAPLASPIYADLKGLPPLLIQVGTSEFLLDDSYRLEKAAKAAGVAVTFEEWPDMIHNWQLYSHTITDGRNANARIGQFIQGHLGRG